MTNKLSYYKTGVDLVATLLTVFCVRSTVDSIIYHKRS